MPESLIPLNNEWADALLIEQAFQCSRDCICIIDPIEMKIVNANQTALQSLGYTKEELLSKTPQEIDATFSNEMIATAFNSIINSKEQHGTFPTVYRRKDGSTFEAEAYLRSFTENNHTYILVSATNTSVLKKAQEKLQFHATLFNSISDAVVATDENFYITNYNKYAQQMFGWNEEEAIGKYTCELKASIYPDAIVKEVEQELFTKGLWKGEIVIQRKNGEAFPAIISLGAVKDEEGSVTGTVAVIRDITEKKQFEKKLKDLNEQLEQRVAQKTEELTNVFNRISDGFTAFDAGWNYTFINKKAAEIIQYEAKEIIGKNIWQEFPELVGTSLYRNYHKAMQEQKIIRTEEYVDSLEKWFEGLLYPSPEGLSVYFHDITEQKKTEEINRFRANLLNIIGQAVIVSDMQGIVTYWNKAATSLYGWSEAEALGNNIVELSSSYQSKEYAEQIMERLAEGKTWSGEYEMQHKNGAVFTVFATATPIYDEHGHLAGIVGVSSDITGRKQTEQALLSSKKNYRLLFEENPVPLWMVDVETFKFIDINRAAIAQYGYSREQFITMHAIDLKVPEEYYFLEIVKQRRAEVKSLEELVRHKKQNGNIISVKLTANLITYNGKEVWLVAGIDVTQELLYEQNLKQSQQQLSLIFNSTDNPMWLMKVEANRQFRLLAANDALASHNNKHKEDLIGCFLHNIFDLSKYQFIVAKYNDCIDSGVVQKFISNEVVNGKEVVFDFTVIPIKAKEGSVTQLLGICADITGHKKREKLLIESEEKYRALFVRSPLPNWIYDCDTLKFLEVNLAATRKYGYTREEFLSMNLYDIRPKERATDIVLSNRRNFPETFEIDSVHRKKNDELIYVHITSHALRYENKEARLVTVVDYTEQEKAKDKLIATTQQLRELASHLQNIREEERTTISREIHDELGQQLTALKMDIAWLNRKWSNENESIRNKFTSATALIDSTINTVRRIAAQLRPSILDNIGLADAIAWQCSEFSSRTGVAVECSSNIKDDKLSPAVSIAVFRIFQEALTNVARHANATKVVCILQKKNNVLYLTVKDNGEGFEINEQAQKKSLGLIGMKERAIMLNGGYNIESKRGKGTAVSIEIPLED